MDVRRVMLGPLVGRGSHQLLDFRLRARLVFMRHAGADEVREGEPFLRHVARHDVGGLLLRVDLAGVGDDRRVHEIGRVERGVVPAPEHLLEPRRRRLAGREDVEELGRLGKAGARRHGGPEPRVMRAELPGRCAAHREAAHHQAVHVDRVTLPHAFQRLEEIHLAGEFVGVAIAAVEVADDRRFRREFAAALHAVLEEGELAQLFAAAVQPEVEPHRVRRIGLPVVGNDEAVRLHRAVDFRAIAAHDEAGLLGPRRLSIAQLLRAFGAERELLFRGVELLHVEELAIPQRPVDRLMKDLHVGQQLNAGPALFSRAGEQRGDPRFACPARPRRRSAPRARHRAPPRPAAGWAWASVRAPARRAGAPGSREGGAGGFSSGGGICRAGGADGKEGIAHANRNGNG